MNLLKGLLAILACIIAFILTVQVTGLRGIIYNYMAGPSVKNLNSFYLNSFNLVAFVFVGLIFGTMNYKLAKRKNRNQRLWLLLGFFFNLWAYIVLKNSTTFKPSR